MAKLPGIDWPGAWHHVAGRGNGGERPLHSAIAWKRFLGLVSELPVRFGLEIHAFVLMDNHRHLLVRSVAGNLSGGSRCDGGAASYHDDDRRRFLALVSEIPERLDAEIPALVRLGVEPGGDRRP